MAGKVELESGRDCRYDVLAMKQKIEFRVENSRHAPCSAFCRAFMAKATTGYKTKSTR